MEFDTLLTQDAHEEGTEINITNLLTGEKTDVFIKVLGVDSREWRRAIKSITKRIIAQKNITEDDHLESEVDMLVAVTVGWRGMVKDGKEYKFTKKICKELYSKSPGVAQQIEAFTGDRQNFIKG